jgi:hypothetical protein
MDSETPLSASDPASAPEPLDSSANAAPHIDPPTPERPYPVADKPAFLTDTNKLGIPLNELITLKPSFPVYADHLEAEAVTNVGKRQLSREELDRVQEYVRRWLHNADKEIESKYSEIRRQAHDNSEKLKDLLKRERGLEKQERKLKEKDKTLAERQKILDEVESIMKEMPENMDEEGTRQYLNKRRKWMIATWESLIKHSTNESTRLKALTRLSDEDRGQHGKDLRDDETAGPKIMLMEKGTYGIPA